MPSPTRTAPLWNDTRAVRDMLARITPDELSVLRRTATVGPDTLVICGEPVTWLDSLRAIHIHRIHGTFARAEAEGRARAYLDAAALQPSVQDVLCWWFGDPNRFSGYGVEGADRAWRAAADDRVARQEAA